MDDRKLLGKQIKTLRKSRGYTQERLAELIDVNAKYLARVERGEANPTLSLLQRLSVGLDVPLPELFGYDREDGETPVELRQRLDQMVAELGDESLPWLVRVVTVLSR